MENRRSARTAIATRLEEVNAEIAHLRSQIAVLDAERVDLHSRQNALEPIARLPTEILAKIFSSFVTRFEHSDLMHFGSVETFSSQEYSQDDSARAEVDRKLLRPDILTLCHISRWWRRTALEYQSLWTHIQVQARTLTKLLRFMWSNAGDLPIKLDFAGTRPDRHLCASHISPTGELVRELLRDNIDRFQSVGVYCYAPHLLDVLRGRAEKLESLVVARDHVNGHVQHREIYDQVLSGGAPNLRRMNLTSFTIPWSSGLLSSPHLTHVALDYTPVPSPESIAELTAFLGNSRLTLETVALTVDFPMEDEPMEFYLSRVTGMTVINLPNLKVFHLYCAHYGPFMAILSLLRMPKDMTTLSLLCRFASDNTAETALNFAGCGLSPTDHITPEEVEIGHESAACWREQRFMWRKDGDSRHILGMDRNPACVEIATQEMWAEVTPVHLPWSFSNLRSITIHYPETPESFLVSLAASQTLEIIRVNASGVICRSFLQALRNGPNHTEDTFIVASATGAVNNQLTGMRKQAIPFPALRAISIIGDPRTRDGPGLLTGVSQAVVMTAFVEDIVAALRKRSTVALEEIRIVSSACLPAGSSETLLTAAHCVVWEKEGGEGVPMVYRRVDAVA